MAEDDSIPMVPSRMIPGRDDMISLLAEMGMDHLVPEQAAPITPEVRPVPGTRFPPLKVQVIPGTPPGQAPGTLSQPASGTHSGPASAIPSRPASGVPSQPVSGTHSGPASAIPSRPASVAPSRPASGTHSGPASAIPSRPASGVPSTPAPVTPEKNPLPAAGGPASAGETGAGIRGPAVFDDPASPGEQYELSTANTIVFLRACDRARKGLTPGELVQFRHLWLKVYGNRV